MGNSPRSETDGIGESGAAWRRATIECRSKSARAIFWTSWIYSVGSLTQQAFATTYVTKKGPSEQALAPRNDGLEIVAINHPNSLFANESFNFKVLFNGKPVTDHEISVYQGKDQFAEESDVEKLTTNANGQASFTPSAQDVYLMQVRLRTDAPDGADVPTYSYTTTLSFEAY